MSERAELRQGGRGEREHRLVPALLLAAALLIALSVAVRPINHDESQYVAAIALMRSGWPYVDFAYLQTPLQPLLLSPLAAIPAGWLLVATRTANGLFAMASLALILAAVRRRVGTPNALIALAALGCTDAFLLGGSAARNDALPMMLIDEAGIDVAQQYFKAAGGDLALRRPAVPAMLTRDPCIVRQDCLCYLMERL